MLIIGYAFTAGVILCAVALGVGLNCMFKAQEYVAKEQNIYYER